MGGTIGIGIIGTGKHGSRYAHHIVADLGSRFHLAAISRRSAEAAAQAAAWGTELHADWRELVASSEVQAVISATPPNLNADIGRFCVERGKPLLIEKPLATDYEEALEMVSLFEEAGLPLTVAQTLRYNSVISALRRHLPSFGRLFSISACQRLEPSSLSWLERPEIAGGGVIFHTAVHLFDALRYITGQEITHIRAVARKIFNPHLEDLVVAEMVLGNGSLATVDASKVGPARSGRYEFVCEKGQLDGDQIHGWLRKIEGEKVTALPVGRPGPTLLPLLEDWHAHLKGQGKNPIPASEGLAAVKACCACRRAAQTGQWVDLAGF